MTDDELKLNRRLFLEYSAAAGTAAAWCGVALKTDALAEAGEIGPAAVRNDGILPYVYHEDPQP
ncbi:MAG: hypothetical protein ACYC6Y_15030 [Thermoguttaceae bacterium]